MTKDPVKVVIRIIFVENGINKDLSWSKKKHENKVVKVGVWHCSTETTLNHVSCKDQESDQGSVKECLSSLGQSHLNLVSMLEQKVADSREVLECYITNRLEVC